MVEGTSAALTSGLTYKNTSFLEPDLLTTCSSARRSFAVKKSELGELSLYIKVKTVNHQKRTLARFSQTHGSHIVISLI